MKYDTMRAAGNFNKDHLKTRIFTSAHFLFDQKKKVIEKSFHI